ncbi:MAG: hypothetical protein ACE362_21725 [Phaeodactylibacter xiamenensis]|uniref:Septum formation initiator n=1 Tax=Phaeodactylibacter xiamenensis TaxID=1524460 RepID=A0A098S3A5_9BACT|nr:hypothetical protein [Phaeodactylibacter xiamenensis]KGE86288.1 hypothetical protein IX84_22275 [Phaeodactylibacter xiamenensis]MCR9052893.1 hypothetical protein [bacterium]
MKYLVIILTIIIGGVVNIHAQADTSSLKDQLQKLSSEIQAVQYSSDSLKMKMEQLVSKDETLQRSVNNVANINSLLQTKIDSLSQKVEKSELDIVGLDQQLNSQKEALSGEISETRETTNQSISALDDALSKNTLYWIIAVLAVGLLSILAFLFLRRKVTDNQSSINESLANTRKELEQEAIRLDEKLIGVMETQLKVIQEERKAQPESQQEEQDHSLALKVADEIVRIEKNISRMDEGTKGLKQLSKAVGRIRDNFAANGYEMVDMVGKPFEEGLKASVTFRSDPDMEGEPPKITRIIKPQVNYKGVMIQQAQIEVSQFE